MFESSAILYLLLDECMAGVQLKGTSSIFALGKQTSKWMIAILVIVCSKIRAQQHVS